MNILLTLRAEIACVVILTYLLVYSWLYGQREERYRFLRLCGWALLHSLLAGVTEVTVNRLDTVSPVMNKSLHIAFYMTAILYCYEFFSYVMYIAYSKEKARRINRAVLVAPLVYLVLTPFLRIDYLTGYGTNYSFGPCVFVGYGLAALLAVVSTVVLICSCKKLPMQRNVALLPMALFILGAILAQVAVPEMLFTGIDGTLVTVGVYFAVENPARRYRDNAMTDMLTSLRSRNCYQEDVRLLDEERPGGRCARALACVTCDLNELKLLNDQCGHSAGDELIHNTAELMLSTLKSAYRVYRVGGDEFTALYVDKEQRTVEAEVAALRQASGRMRLKNGRQMSLSIGCAFAKPGSEQTLDMLVKAADCAMYQDKAVFRANKKQAAECPNAQ